MELGESDLIRAKEVILHDLDIASALCEYIKDNSVTTIVLGASNRSALARAFGNSDVPTVIGKSAPDSCSVYVVTKGKGVKIKSAIDPLTPDSATKSSPFHAFSPDSTSSTNQRSWGGSASDHSSSDGSKNTSLLNSANNSREFHQITPKESNESQIDLSYSAPGSSELSYKQNFQSDVSYEQLDQPRISDSSRSSTSSQTTEIEDELKRLKLELMQITEKYKVACHETSTAREKVRDIVHWKLDGSKLEEAVHAQDAALAIVERERQKCKVAVDVANKAQHIAELESEKRKCAELKFKHEYEEKQKAIDALGRTVVRYRRYSINEIEVATDYFSDSAKIGEGSYGPVYKATLDHTPVAIKVLRPDMSQGQQQFQREVEVLSRMRHPNMVILLGACPEYGCLVYEYMENGSLEDRLDRLNETPPLPWSIRFRIAAEIATALNFLHHTKPEPLVHRDLKPANILLDKNYVSKISDVGLARLVPPSIPDTITQYRMTAAAGTFCYIDPEYQQTGLLGTKSDIYSLGVMLLQIITAKAPMGLTHIVESAIENGHFAEVLDQTLKDWPVEEALSYAKLALKCCELRRRDRPDLNSIILPELERLKDLGSKSNTQSRFCYMYSRGAFEDYSSSSQASQSRFDYTNSEDQSYEGSSYTSQETRNTDSETRTDDQSRSAGTITSFETMD
ncbi:hypothetical protein RD792_012891 [Penstemon davidsonii]|uniref:RING-type E3 ubiquitin transferase n=1 Tax=Penstemon davidsonii TaxID=160366 RepID=A0ABR0CZK2_9LAMI|nr:hypothetical protein RD792_012891 [Penstemon davidsonii]